MAMPDPNPVDIIADMLGGRTQLGPALRLELARDIVAAFQRRGYLTRYLTEDGVSSSTKSMNPGVFVMGLMTLMVNGELESARRMCNQQSDLGESTFVLAQMVAENYTPEAWAVKMLQLLIESSK